MHLLEGQFGLLGLGIYLTKPMNTYSAEERIGKWFTTFEVNLLSVSFGGNVAKNSGYGKREWTDSNNQFGNQHYAYGKSYLYIQYAIPIRLQFWKEMKGLSVGMFVDVDAFLVEKSFDLTIPHVIGYNLTAGLILRI